MCPTLTTIVSKSSQPRGSSWGISGEFSKPAGIGMDTSDHDMVYVCEADNQRVSVFTSEGHSVCDIVWKAG